MKLFTPFLLVVLPLGSLMAQQSNTPQDKEAAYTNTINTRAQKIVSSLNISDSVKASSLTVLIAGQYRHLNEFYTRRDEAVARIKAGTEDRQVKDKAVKEVEEATTTSVRALHSVFISQLSALLTPEQVNQVKDGMTYGVLHVTYNGYVDMIPRLTAEQKAQIMAWLVEARELAMDAESSDKKHWWFGKYKGRINNYLSAQGYDIQKERKEWEERIKARKDQKKLSQNQ